jgi:hypothetical protein
MFLNITNDNIYYENNNKKIFMYSKRNPRKSAKIEIDRNFDKNYSLNIIIGNGIGYHAEYLYTKNKGKGYYLIVEPNGKIHEELNKKFNFFEKYKERGNITYFYGNLASNKEKLYNYLISKIYFFHDFKIYINDFYKHIFLDEIKKYVSFMKETVSLSLIQRGNSPDDSILGYYNSIRNIYNFKNIVNIQKLKKYYKNKPAIIVSAGPSLDKNIKYLKDNQDNFIIISQDATYKKCFLNGITPDFIMSIERDYITYEKFFLNQIEKYNISKTILVGASVIWPKIGFDFKGPKAFIMKETIPFEKMLSEKMNNEIISFNTQRNVGGMGLNFAKFLGCNPIILIGQDFCYSPEGFSHSTGVEVRKNVKNKEGMIQLKDIYNNNVLTTKTLYEFKIEMEKSIENIKEKVINCTEGGLNIKGAKNKNLINILSKYNLKIDKIKVNDFLYKEEKQKKIKEKYLNIFKDSLNIIDNKILEYKDLYENIEIYIKENTFLKKIEDLFNSKNSVILLIMLQPTLNNLMSNYLNNKVEDLKKSLLNVIEILKSTKDYFLKGFYYIDNIEEINNKIEKIEDPYEKVKLLLENYLPFEARELAEIYINDSSIDKDVKNKIILEIAESYTNFYIEKYLNIRKAMEIFMYAYKNDKSIIKTEKAQKIIKKVQNETNSLEKLKNNKFFDSKNYYNNIRFNLCMYYYFLNDIENAKRNFNEINDFEMKKELKNMMNI